MKPRQRADARSLSHRGKDLASALCQIRQTRLEDKRVAQLDIWPPLTSSGGFFVVDGAFSHLRKEHIPYVLPVPRRWPALS